jgi:hypothetical protein
MAAVTEQRPLGGFELLQQYLEWREGTFALVEATAEQPAQ